MRATLSTLLLMLGWATISQAVPVRVLSRSLLESQIEKRWDRLVVQGRLLDDQQRPLALSELSLAVAGETLQTQISDSAGGFTFTVNTGDLDELLAERREESDPLSAVRLEFTVRYVGDSRHGAQTQRHIIDVSRETLALQVAVVPARVQSGQRPRVLAVLRHGIEPARGRLLLATLGGQEFRLRTDSQGTVRFEDFEAPAPGRYLVKVSYAGNETFNAVSVEREVLIYSHSRVTLERRDDAPNPTEVRVRGRLERRGGPAVGTVTLVVGDLAVHYAESDAYGAYEATIDLTAFQDQLPAGQSRLRAVFSATEPWEVGAISPAILVTLPPPPPAAMRFYLVPLVLLLLGLALHRLIRGGRLQRWLAALKDRFRAPVFRRGSAGDGRARLVEAVSPPVSPRQVVRDRVSGWVWDTHQQHSLAGCQLTLAGTGGEPTRTQETGADGRFDWTALPSGDYTMHVVCPGFRDEEIAFQIPHRGQYTRVRIRLTPLRLLARIAYENSVRRQSGGTLQFGRQTPRELGDALPGPRTLLARLTRAFETLYYRGNDRATERQRQETLALLTEWERPEPEGEV